MRFSPVAIETGVLSHKYTITNFPCSTAVLISLRQCSDCAFNLKESLSDKHGFPWNVDSESPRV